MHQTQENPNSPIAYYFKIKVTSVLVCCIEAKPNSMLCCTCSFSSHGSSYSALSHVLHVMTTFPPKLTSIHIPWLEELHEASAPSAKHRNVSVPTWRPSRSILLFSTELLASPAAAKLQQHIAAASHQPSALIGFCLSQSVQLGRVAVVRAASGLVAAINLTRFEELHSLQLKMQSDAKVL